MSSTTSADNIPEQPLEQPREQDRSENKKAKPFYRRYSLKGAVIIGLIVVAIIIGAIYGWPYYQYTATHASTDDAFIEGNIIPISPWVDGHVKKIYVVDNQPVKKGQLLVELEPALLKNKVKAARAALAVAQSNHASSKINIQLTQINTQAMIDQAKAQVAQAKAAIATAQARLQTDASSIIQAKAQVTAAKAQAQSSIKDLNRYQKLQKTGAVSSQKLGHVQAAAKVTLAKVAAAKAAVKAAADMQLQDQSRLIESKTDLVKAQVKLKKAQSRPQKIALSVSNQQVRKNRVTQAKAKLKQAKLNLSYTKIYAPVSGTVTKKTVQPGQYLVSGQIIMSIVSQKVWVKANYKETQLAPIHTGQKVAIVVDAYPDHLFHGVVQSIMSGTGSRFSLLPPENATGNYIKVVQRVPVKIIFNPQPDYQKYHLAPGMSAVPYIDTAQKPDDQKQKPVTQPKNTAPHSAPATSNTTNPSP